MIANLRSHRDRVVLNRFHLHEEDRDSICRDLGLTADQFTTVLYRARLRLGRLLDAQGVREPTAASGSRYRMFALAWTAVRLAVVGVLVLPCSAPHSPLPSPTLGTRMSASDQTSPADLIDVSQ